MSGPLPLRLCCMATMAPALTEAAAQAKIKLPESTSAAISNSTIVNGRTLPVTKSENPSTEILTRISKPVGSLASRTVPSHLNGDSLTVWTSGKSGTGIAQLGAIKVQKTSLKDLIAKHGHCLQHERIKALAQERQIMNQSSTGHGNEEAEKCRMPAQNGSHDSPTLRGICITPAADASKDVSALGGTNGQLNSLTRIPTVSRNADGGIRNVPLIKPSAPNTGVQAVSKHPAAKPPGITISTSTESSVDAPPSDPDVDKLRFEVFRKQAQLERKTEFLVRRLRRVQGRQVESHTRQQLIHFVEYQHKNLQTVAKSISPHDGAGDLKAELFSDDVKSMSTAALVNLVRRLQSTQSAQQINPYVPPVKPDMANVVTMDESTRNESKVTAEKLMMNLKFMQSALDSDATESSSGGESDEDEPEKLESQTLPPTPLLRRAEWKWAMERAAVASRWTWLQAQVSDLEYRIRQQSEVYKQVKLAKGPVILGEQIIPQDLLQHMTRIIPHRNSVDMRLPGSASVAASGIEVSPCNVSSVLSNVDKQASRLTQSLGNCLSPAASSPASSAGGSRTKSAQSSPATAPNGITDSPASISGGETDTAENSPLGQSGDLRVTMDSVDLSPVLDIYCRAARCLPLKYPLRKRKLLRATGLHLLSRKAARSSTVKCQCHPPTVPCVLCGGRSNLLQPVDSDSMPFPERVALLDHSYHHVLSFSEEVPLSVHFEGLLKSGEWQNKPPVRRPRAEYRRQKGLPGGGTATGRKGNSRQFRKNAASVIISSAKIRSKYEIKTVRKVGAPAGKRLGKRAMNSEMQRRRAAAMAAIKEKPLKGGNETQYPYETPTPSPVSKELVGICPISGLKDVRKRRGESAYDINNIVIPYSMAAATRVEKLQYKEIVTPKWRDLTVEDDTKETAVKVEAPEHKSNGLISKRSQEEEVEELSDEVFTERHKVCEAEERKRFSSVQFPTVRRTRTRSEAGFGSIHQVASGPDFLHPEPLSQPVSMGTQASLDVCGELGEESQDSQNAPLSHSVLSSLATTSQEDDSSSSFSNIGNIFPGASSHRGSVSFAPSLYSLDSGMEEEGPRIEPWPLRQFPLTDEENEQLKLEQLTTPPSGPYSLRAVQTSVAVESMSRAESSASGSQPGSPFPSSVSTSHHDDDSMDTEWTADAADMPKRSKVAKK